ncbi:hypothetical protein AcW1_006621 [Taiwanofungus camphoratus]|nr:hypothetical protein AcV5_009209 [Antrodia cinnamomea]KAI0924508.1 hypothetical protein AcW2_005382 [Antrodia cinnamomea]KAI0954850.1 hypothetical protein AcW1_006621 [Antrodia cinnamomea]
MIVVSNFDEPQAVDLKRCHFQMSTCPIYIFSWIHFSHTSYFNSGTAVFSETFMGTSKVTVSNAEDFQWLTGLDKLGTFLPKPDTVLICLSRREFFWDLCHSMRLSNECYGRH